MPLRVFPWEGAASVEHKSGDLLILCILGFLRTMGKLKGLQHQRAVLPRSDAFCTAFLPTVFLTQSVFLFAGKPNTGYISDRSVGKNKNKRMVNK